MPYCKKCGAELPEYAVFCTKCGLKYPVSGATDDDNYAEQQPQQTVAEKKPVVQNTAPEQQNSAPIQPSSTQPNTGAQSEWFKNNSMALFIILGIVSYVLLQLCSQIAFSAFAFGVVLGVFSLLCAIAFCVVGIIRYVMNGKIPNKKHTTCDNVCLALSIIGVIFVLFMVIFVLGAADSLLSLSKLF